jgi:hypothetical protein
MGVAQSMAGERRRVVISVAWHGFLRATYTIGGLARFSRSAVGQGKANSSGDIPKGER